MNVATMTMEPEVARKKLNAYRQSVNRTRGAALSERLKAEYNAAIDGYEALAAGTPLISLPDVIRAGGFDALMRPNLAIGRADRAQVAFTWHKSETFGEFSTRSVNTQHFYPTLQMRIEFNQLHGVETRHWSGELRAFALIPLIPPACRPASGQLKDYHILWEVEQWAAEPKIAIPDRDPYLIKHIGGDLWAVIAEWDLTDLERAVMAGRATQS